MCVGVLAPSLIDPACVADYDICFVGASSLCLRPSFPCATSWNGAWRVWGVFSRSPESVRARAGNTCSKAGHARSEVLCMRLETCMCHSWIVCEVFRAGSMRSQLRGALFAQRARGFERASSTEVSRAVMAGVDCW